MLTAWTVKAGSVVWMGISRFSGNVASVWCFKSVFVTNMRTRISRSNIKRILNCLPLHSKMLSFWSIGLCEHSKPDHGSTFFRFTWLKQPTGYFIVPFSHACTSSSILREYYAAYEILLRSIWNIHKTCVLWYSHPNFGILRKIQRS